MSKIKQKKIPMTLTEDNVMKIAVEQGVIDDQFKWKLVRENDGLTKKSKEIMWVEWNKEAPHLDRHSEPAVGRSLLMSPFSFSFTWMTTEITEILEQDDNYIKFKTRNSTYELWHKDN